MKTLFRHLHSSMDRFEGEVILCLKQDEENLHSSMDRFEAGRPAYAKI